MARPKIGLDGIHQHRRAPLNATRLAAGVTVGLPADHNPGLALARLNLFDCGALSLFPMKRISWPDATRTGNRPADACDCRKQAPKRLGLFRRTRAKRGPRFSGVTRSLLQFRDPFELRDCCIKFSITRQIIPNRFSHRDPL
jgi:hypothetical protein